MNTYNYDFTTDTLTVSTSFLRSAGQYGSAEYRKMMGLRHDHPNMKIVEQKRKSSKESITVKKPTPKFEQMKDYIRLFPEADAKNYLVRFEKVKKLSKFQPSPYAYVRDWFLDAFPFFTAEPQMDENGNIENLMSKWDIENHNLGIEMERQISVVKQNAADKQDVA